MPILHEHLAKCLMIANFRNFVIRLAHRPSTNESIAKMPRRKASTNQETIDVNQKESKRRKNDGDDVAVYVDRLRKLYQANYNAANAKKMKSYLRGQFEFFGLKAPERRSLDQEIITILPEWTADKINSFLNTLWEQEERDFQMFAIDFARRKRDLLSCDINTSLSSVETVKHLLTQKSWWDTVDMLASQVIGHFVKKYPDELKPIMEEWISDDNMWLRRTAILHQLTYKKQTDKDMLFRYCLLCCHEKEFFIQKAIGWALRELSKSSKKEVEAFINKNKSELAKLSIREGSKYL